VCSPVAEWLELPRFAGDADEALALGRLAAERDFLVLPADLLLGVRLVRLRLDVLSVDLRPPVFFLAVMLGSSLTPVL
jgi:hypothetical protein